MTLNLFYIRSDILALIALVNEVINLYVVKEWLGHSTISVTEKYVHLATQKLAEATATLDL